MQMKNMISTYQKLNVFKTSIIPGIREIYLELKNIFSTFIKGRENISIIVDDMMFENDSNKFDIEVDKWKNRVKIHINTVIEQTPDFGNKIILLKKCEKLNLNNLELDSVYIKILKNIMISK